MNSALPSALVDFLQSLILPNAVLDMDDVIANLQVAEVGEKCRGLGFLPLRTRDNRLRFVEQITRAQDCQIRVGEQ